jgi:uncharacterized RDD family membrane protein YckC
MSKTSNTRSTWYSQIIENMRKKGSEELVDMLNKHDSNDWSDEAFLAAEEVLAERGHTIPAKPSDPSLAEEMPTELPVDPPDQLYIRPLPEETEQTSVVSGIESNLMEIFIAKREQRTGPFTIQQIETMILSGMIDISDMAWHAGMTDWAPLHQVLGVCPPPPRADVMTVIPKNPKPKSKNSGLPAGFGSRVIAIIIDNLILFPINFVAAIAVAVVTNTSEDSIGIVWFFSGFVISFLYFSVMESSPKMATLGKMALGLVVVDYKGRRLSIDKAASRFVGRFISALTLGIGFLMPLWTKKKQCLHDIIASTLVIHR